MEDSKKIDTDLRNNKIKAIDSAIKNYGAFFSFSPESLKEIDKCDYVYLGAGIICPIKTKEKLKEDINKAISDFNKDRLSMLGLDEIIRLELVNHEYGYTWDTAQTVEALNCYNVTKEQVLSIAKSMDWSSW